MASKTVAVQIAIRNAEAAIRVLKSLGAEGEAALDKITTTAPRAAAALNNVEREIGKAGKSGAVFQQLGYQVNDFFVQVQGGQGILTALVQQGSQIAGAFGPVGAIISVAGAAASVAAGYFFNLNEETKKSPDFLKGFSDNLDVAKQRADEYTQALNSATGATAALFRTAANLQKGDYGRQAAGLSEELASDLRDRLVTDVERRGRAGEFTGAAPGAGVLARGKAVETANQVQEDLAAAAAEGNTSRLDQIIEKYGLLNEKTREIVAQLREAAAQVKGIDRGDHAGISEDLAQAQFRAQQLPADYDRLRPRAPVPASKSDAAAEADLGRQEQAAEAAAAKSKAAADAAERQVKAGRDLIASMELEADSAEKLAAATGVSTVARQKAQIEIDKEKSILQAAKTVHGEELEHFKELAKRVADAQLKMVDLNNARKTLNQSPAALRNQVERESMVALDEYNRQKVLDEDQARTDAAQQAADDLHKILLQPWLDLSSETAQITTGIFDDLQEKGEISSGKIASGLNETFRKSLSGLGGNLLTLPLNQAVASLGQSLTESLKPGGSIGGAFKQFYNDNPVLASAGLGFAAGSAIDMVRGKQTYAGLGGAIGAGAGAVIGSIVPGVGTVAGGLVGGALGTLAGSLFSSGGGLGNDNSQQSYVLKSGKIEYSDKSFSAGNRQITSGVLGQIAQLQESLAGLGATFQNTALNVQAGNKSGYQLNGRKYGSEQELLQATIKELLRNTSGLSATEQTVLKNTKGRSNQEVLSDLDFAKTFDRLTKNNSDFMQAIDELGRQFDAAEARAKKLGLSTKDLAAAQEKATKETIEAQGLGAIDRIDGFLSPLKAALGPFGIGQGYVAPQATVSGGLDLFRETLAKAQSGDTDALSSIVGLGQSTLQAARSYGASGSSFAEIFKEVNKGLLEVQAALEEKRAAVFKDIASAANETVDQLEAVRKQNDNLFGQLELLRHDLRLILERRA